MKFGIIEFLTLIGALGFFIYGMKVMSDGIQKVAGSKMRSILSKMTSTRFLGITTGFILTALLQSSSATTVMIVSFVNAGLLSLVESIGVVMGANIGTTITAWLISLLGFKVKISSIALPIIAIGFPMMFSSKSKIKAWAEVLIGFALLFMGLDELKHSVPNLKESPEFLEFVRHYANMGILTTIIFVGVGTLLTLIVQSSSAAMAITLIMCYYGYIPFELAAAMVLGENIGTTITANLAAMVGNVHAKRAAKAHLIFNVFGVIWMIFTFSFFINGINSFMSNNPTIIKELVELKNEKEYVILDNSGYPVIENGLEKIFPDFTVAENYIKNNPDFTLEERKTTWNLFLFKSEEKDFIDWLKKEKNYEIQSVKNSEDIYKTEERVLIEIFNSKDKKRRNAFCESNIGRLRSMEEIENVSDNYICSPIANRKAVPIALAIFHTVFNIFNVLLLVWFVPLISRIVIRMQPSKGETDEEFHLEHIGGGLMQTAELSVLEAKKEVIKFGEITTRLFNMIPALMKETDNKKFDALMKRIRKYEDITDKMEVEIADYLAKSAQGEMSDAASIKVRSMISIINDMERIGDICYQISISIERKKEKKADFTNEATKSIEDMLSEIQLSLNIMNNNLNSDYAQVSLTEANNSEININNMRNKLRKSYLQKIEKGEMKIQTGMIYNNLIHSLEKIGDHIFNVSEAIVGDK